MPRNKLKNTIQKKLPYLQIILTEVPVHLSSIDIEESYNGLRIPGEDPVECYRQAELKRRLNLQELIGICSCKMPSKRTEKEVLSGLRALNFYD